MSNTYSSYLAAQVLNEGRVVNYRMLSRAIQVHNNVAKRMLFDFYEKQNAKKPGSIHATYLMSGEVQGRTHAERTRANGYGAKDTVMDNIPIDSSAMEMEEAVDDGMNTLAIILVREVDVEDARKQFDGEAIVHIYSLSPSPLKDLQVLADCNQAIASKYPVEAALTSSNDYGTITNPHVKRRTMRRAALPAASTAAKATEAPKQFFTGNANKVTPETASGPESISKKPAPSRSAAVTPSASDSRGIPNKKTRPKFDFFKTSTKANDKASRPATQEPTHDEPMRDASEEEQEEDFTVNKAESAEEQRIKKAQRKESLRQMMEQEDEPMEDASEVEKGAEEAKEDESPTASQSQLATQEKEPEKSEDSVIVSGGRRRGRRRTMKKKTIKDEEGYLVTREEPVWESFSEDEPATKAKTATFAASSNKGAGKSAPKKGQGNIMKFFSKK